jgi:hypothetical protein
MRVVALLIALAAHPGAARAEGDVSLTSGANDAPLSPTGKKLVEPTKVAPEEEKITPEGGVRELAEAKLASEAAGGTNDAANANLVKAQRSFDAGTQRLVDEAKQRAYPGGQTPLESVGDWTKRLAGTAAGLAAGPAAAAWDKTGGAVVNVAHAALDPRQTPDEARETQIRGYEQDALTNRQKAVDAVEKPLASSFQNALEGSREVSRAAASLVGPEQLRLGERALTAVQTARASIPGAGSLKTPQNGERLTVHPPGNSVTVARPGDTPFVDDARIARRYAGVANIYNSHGLGAELDGRLPKGHLRKFLADPKPLIVASCFSAAPMTGGSSIRRLVSAYGTPGAASRVYGCSGFASADARSGFGCTGVWLDANGKAVPLVERRRLRLLQENCKVNTLVGPIGNARTDTRGCQPVH